MLSINQSIMGKKEIVSNSETSKIPSELSEFTSVKIIYLTEIIINKVVKMSGSETFCRFTFANRKTIKIPFRIAHKSDAQEILGFMKNTHAYNLSPFKSFIQNLAQQEKIDLPKSVDERMAEIGLQTTESLKEMLRRNRILMNRKISHYVDWFQDSSNSSIRIQLWTGSTPDTPPEFLENDSSESPLYSVNSNPESNFRPDFTELEVAALASNIAKAEFEEVFANGPEGSIDTEKNIIFLCRTREKYSYILKYVRGVELNSLKNFLKVFSSNNLANFPDDIHSRMSKFGQQVMESLKKHFEAHESIKSGKLFYDIIWIDERFLSGISLSIWNGPTPQHILKRRGCAIKKIRIP